MFINTPKHKVCGNYKVIYLKLLEFCSINSSDSLLYLV